MPQFDYYPSVRKFATEARLLKFANKLRAAGDADPLDALMPSKPKESKACLIANAVNFRSAVWNIDGTWPDGSWKWHMVFPRNMADERVAEIAKAVGCKTEATDWNATRILDARTADEYRARGRKVRLVLLLPKDIGNTAQAFDRGEGWTTKYDKGT